VTEKIVNFYFPPPCTAGIEKFSMTNMTFIAAREYFYPSGGIFCKDNTAGDKKHSVECRLTMDIVRVGAEKGQFHPFNKNNKGKLSEPCR
jgi:hypothetical protein